MKERDEHTGLLNNAIFMVVILVVVQASGFKNNYSLMMYKTVFVGCGNHLQGILTEGEGSVQLTSLN